MNSKYKAISLILAGSLLYKISKFLYNKIRNIKKNSKLKEDETMREILDRNYQFFEQDGMNKIRNSSIAIINLDSIGNNCALTLIRSGVKRLQIFDNSQINYNDYIDFVSNPLALNSNIGQSKIELIKEFAVKINPNIIIESYNNLDFSLINTDFVIDCLHCKNDIELKCNLIQFLSENNIKFVSNFIHNDTKCFDSTKLGLAKINNIFQNNLMLNLTRSYQKKYKRALPNINVAYSCENDNGLLNEGFPFVFSVASQSICSFVLCELANFEEFLESQKKKECK